MIKSPIEMNNKMILLRQYVRQARICVINKLIRKAKRLQINDDNEKSLEKRKNKAEKYLREVLELKHIKDDEISKFGIIHFNNLQNILQDSETDNRTRAMIKVVCYKRLNTKIMEFLKNFPNSNEYISCNKKEHSSRRKKKDVISELKKNLKEVPNSKHEINTGLDIKDTLDKEMSESEEQLREHEKDRQFKGDNNKINKKNLEFVSKVISKEVTVKRCSDILKESSALRINDEHKDSNKKQFSPIPVTVMRNDDFFLNSSQLESDVNAPVLAQEKDSNITSTTEKKLLITYENKNAKRTFSRNVGNERNGNDKAEKAGNKNVLYHRHSVKKNTVFWKGQNEALRMKETSERGNFEYRKFLENENKSLHPSWAAKRKLQNIMKEGFQGKKIRFEEN